MKLTNIIENYPGIKLFNREGKLHESGGDIFIINETGRNERITEAVVLEYKRGHKIWFKLEIKETTLVDKGIGEDLIL